MRRTRPTTGATADADVDEFERLDADGVRLASDSKKRRVVMNPESQWAQHPDESIRIVPDVLWDAVKRRQHEQHARVGKRVSASLAKRSAKSTGRVEHHLFSGLLKCSACGSTYTLADKRFYACAGYVNGRVCSNGRRVRRDRLEEALLKDVRAGLMDPEVLGEMERRARQVLRSRKRDDGSARSTNWKQRLRAWRRYRRRPHVPRAAPAVAAGRGGP
jgi:site-specific DNA recombinase